jgi:hypothetical protein
MKSQLFKSIVPICILFELLDKICIKDEKYYHLSKSAFKAAEYHNLIPSFCSSVSEHYRKSKQYYVDRKMNYNKFITVVRQICNINNVPYTSKIVYIKSYYDIVYYVSRTGASDTVGDTGVGATDSNEVGANEVGASATDANDTVGDTGETAICAIATENKN